MSACPDNGIGWEMESVGPAFMLLGLILLVNTIVSSPSCGALSMSVKEDRSAAASQTLSRSILVCLWGLEAGGWRKVVFFFFLVESTSDYQLQSFLDSRTPQIILSLCACKRLCLPFSIYLHTSSSWPFAQLNCWCVNRTHPSIYRIPFHCYLTLKLFSYAYQNNKLNHFIDLDNRTLYNIKLRGLIITI